MKRKLIFDSEEVHNKAMFLSQDAFMCIVNGEEDQAIPLYEQAFELERQAALSLLDKKDFEPIRSILFRSAAALAKKCHKYQDAEKMIGFGLAGNPPEDVAEELRELFDAVKKLQQPKQAQSKASKHAVVLNV